MSANTPGPSAARPLIVFSHANSYPASTYRRHFALWEAEGFEVRAIEKYGHDPRYPVTNGWPHLGRQITDFIRAQDRPMFLVGHSMGGYLSLMGASRCPQRVRGIVLLDSPVLFGWKARAMRWIKALGFAHWVGPARVSASRRNEWEDTQQVYQHFAGKSLFARWSPEVLADYVHGGTARAGQRRTLAFQREVETAIYNTVPDHLSHLLRTHPLQCPVAFIGGRHSFEIQQVGMGATRRLTQGRITWFDGTHLFPFEQPEATCSEVVRWLRLFMAQEKPAAQAAAAAHPL